MAQLQVGEHPAMTPEFWLKNKKKHRNDDKHNFKEPLKKLREILEIRGSRTISRKYCFFFAQMLAVKIFPICQFYGIPQVWRGIENIELSEEIDYTIKFYKYLKKGRSSEIDFLEKLLELMKTWTIILVERYGVDDNKIVSFERDMNKLRYFIVDIKKYISPQ
jgi:hypothetical protein